MSPDFWIPFGLGLLVGFSFGAVFMMEWSFWSPEPDLEEPDDVHAG